MVEISLPPLLMKVFDIIFPFIMLAFSVEELVAVFSPEESFFFGVEHEREQQTKIIRDRG